MAPEAPPLPPFLLPCLCPHDVFRLVPIHRTLWQGTAAEPQVPLSAQPPGSQCVPSLPPTREPLSATQPESLALCPKAVITSGGGAANGVDHCRDPQTCPMRSPC